MDISTTDHKRVTVVEVSGRIDSNTASEFDETIQHLINSGNKNLVLYLSDVEFLSSAGLRTMVSARKAIQGSGEITLAKPSQRVVDTLEIAGLDVLFKTFPDRESAIGYY
ncbi:MAG: STAS domain-containing protein [Anaerolineales bacterium]